MGKTHNPEGRRKAHLYITSGNTATNKYLIHKAIDKYGKDNFTFQIIEEFEYEKDALEAEKFWIEFFRTDINRFGNDCGYNLTAGGDGVSGRKHTQETKDKVSKTNKGRKFSTETRKRMSQSHIGKPSGMLGHKQTDNQKRLQSENNKGEKSHFYGKHNNAGCKNYFHTHNYPGEQNKNAKLSDKQVMEIIDLLKHKIYKQNVIASMYNIKPCTINKIKLGHTWKHLPR